MTNYHNWHRHKRVIPCQINTVTRHDHHRSEWFLV